MAASFRNSRFRAHNDVGEDVNPSAYIVNLADCMLVLACGVIVSLVAAWNIDLPSTATETVDESQMEEVASENIDEEALSGGGNSYSEVGKAYQDPETGTVYIVKPNNSDSSSSSSSSGSSSSSSSSSGSSSSGTSSSSGSSTGSSSGSSSTGSSFSSSGS